MKLHIGNKNYSSWSLRPWLLMRELGVPFEEALVPFEAHGSFAAFRAFSPTGRVPTLEHEGRVVWDSLAIVEYLAERVEGVWPADAGARAWARSAAAEMHSGFGALRDTCTMNIGVRVRLAGRPVALEADIARIAELWDDGLARFGGPFLAGDRFCAVDAFYAPVAFRAQTYGLDELLGDYGRRLLALPAMREWEAAALAETWREPDHEAEAVAAGEWTSDLRAGG